MKIAVVDDVPRDAQLLVQFLNRFQMEQGIALQIRPLYSSIDFLEEYDGTYDIVFLDIEMPGSMVRLALIMLMAAIILSVYYTSGIVMEQGTVASEVICPMYSALCCMLVLFMEFYVLRENRMEREMMEQMLQMANDRHAP